MSSRTKPEGVAVSRMKLLGNQVHNDAQLLKSKHISSPEIKDLPFFYYDPSTHATIYFRTEERKNRYLERMAEQSQLSLKRGGR